MNDDPQARRTLWNCSPLWGVAVGSEAQFRVERLADEESLKFDSIVSCCVAQGSVQWRVVQRK